MEFLVFQNFVWKGYTDLQFLETPDNGNPLPFSWNPLPFMETIFEKQGMFE
jgi:hypothetical protein